MRKQLQYALVAPLWRPSEAHAIHADDDQVDDLEPRVHECGPFVRVEYYLEPTDGGTRLDTVKTDLAFTKHARSSAKCASRHRHTSSWTLSDVPRSTLWSMCSCVLGET